LSDDEREFFRFRSKLWGDLQLNPHIGFHLQFNNEFRKYLTPDQDVDYDEIIVELCYLDLDNIAGSPWSVRIGRQNVMRGNGFVLFDGSPLDGSRSAYMNAVVLKYAFHHSSLELMGISNPSKDQYFPVISDEDRALIEWDEQALGLYWQLKIKDNDLLDLYYLYKTETDSLYQHEEIWFQPDRYYHIAGLVFEKSFGNQWNLACEASGEIGEEDPDREIRAYAGYADLTKRFDFPVKPYIKAGFAGFSGDDPDTYDIEGWSPPMSRWPKWSDLYIYSYLREKGIAYWSNTYWFNAELGFSMGKHLKMKANYSHLEAFETLPGTQGTHGVFDQGKNRGDLYLLRLDYTLFKGLTGHVLYEYFNPGNYYPYQDAGHFFRVELTYQFSSVFPRSGEK